MAIYKLFSSKDSFVYTEKQLANNGRDELLEVGGYNTSAGGQTLRTLIQFDTTELQDIINNKAGGGTVRTDYICILVMPTNYLLSLILTATL